MDRIIGYFSFLFFTLSLVGVGFGLSVLGGLGTSANTLATSREASSSSITIYATNSSATSFVSIASAGANIMLISNAHAIFGKFSNTGFSIRASKNSWFMCTWELNNSILKITSVLL